jgi:hypothetical protein
MAETISRILDGGRIACAKHYIGNEEGMLSSLFFFADESAKDVEHHLPSIRRNKRLEK